MGIADGGWGSSAQTILLVDNGDVNYPWTHKVTVQGKVTPLFYNPQNPDETSPVKTSTCTMQFAYFSARWNWGYLYLTMTGPYSQRPTLLFMGNFSNPAQRPPVMGTTDKQGNFYQHSTSGFNLPYSNSSSMNYSGTTVGTAYYYILGDMLYVNMAGSASNLPNIGGGTMTMYGASSIFFDNYGKSDNYMLSRLGTGMNFFNGAGNSYQSNGNILIGRTESVGTYIYFTGSSTMTTGTDYQPSVEYIYNATNISEVPLNVHANAFMAVAYNGTYNIFQK